jgi:hypothetical protein
LADFYLWHENPPSRALGNARHWGPGYDEIPEF